MNDINFEKDQEEVLDRTENIKSLADQVKNLRDLEDQLKVDEELLASITVQNVCGTAEEPDNLKHQ